MEYPRTPLSICHPGFGASCALCCGSHNYAAAPGEIEALFRDRAHVLASFTPAYLAARVRASRSDLTGSYYFPRGDFAIPDSLPPRDAGGLHCPFLMMAEEGRPACFMGDDDGYVRDCLRRYRGRTALCAARDALSDDEIRYAARLTGDWFYYPLLLHDPALLRSVMDDWPGPAAVPDRTRGELFHRLEDCLHSNRALFRTADYFG